MRYTKPRERGEVNALLDRVGADVEALLSRKLNEASITVHRYYELSADDMPFMP